MTPAAIATLAVLLAASPGAPEPARDAYDAAGALERGGAREDAVPAYERARALAREAGDTFLEASALNHLGILLHGLGREREALAAHREALAIRTALGHRAAMGQSHNNLGIAWHTLGNSSKCLEHHERAFALAAPRGRSRAIAGVNLANELGRIGDYARALATLRALETSLSPEVVATQRAELDYYGGKLRHRFDRFGEARTLLASAEKGFARRGGGRRAEQDDRLGGYASLELGRIARESTGRPGDALPLLDRADARFREAGHAEGRLRAGIERAYVALATRDVARARRELRRARELGRRLGVGPVGEAAVEGTLADIDLSAGGLAEAEAAAGRSLRGFEEVGDLSGQASGHFKLGVVALARGDVPRGTARFERAIGLWSALRALDQVVRARSRLTRELAVRGLVEAAKRELEAAARLLPRTFSHRTRIAYLLAEAYVRAASGDDAGAEAALAAARALAEENADRGLARELDEARKDVSRIREERDGRAGTPAAQSAAGPGTGAPSTAGPRAGTTAAAGAPAPKAAAAHADASPAPTPAGGTVIRLHGAPPPALRLAPAVASATAAPDEVARYRWVLTNDSERALDVSISVGRERVAHAEKSDSLLRVRTASGDPEGNEELGVRLPARGSIPVFVDVEGRGLAEERVVSLAARAGGAEATASFLARFEADAGARPLVGLGIDRDPELHGVEFFHEVRPELAAPAGIAVAPSRPCPIHVVDAATGELLAVDGNGDGDFAGRGDGLFRDEDGDLLPDAPRRDGAPAPFLVLAFPPREALEAGEPIELEVKLVDSAGRTISARTDVLLIDRAGGAGP